MNKIKNIVLLMVAAIAGLFASSCKEYMDDMQDLGKRVVALEEDSLKFTQEYERLMNIIGTINSYQRITNVTKDKDGNWVLHFEGEDETITLKDGIAGTDGKDFDISKLGVKQAPNGKIYWTYEGEWLRDKDGNPIEITVVKGKDAEDVDPRSLTGVPIIVIDPITGCFKYTYDTEYDPSTRTWRPLSYANWIDTGLKAKGETGDKGEKGEDGDMGTITIHGGMDYGPYLYAVVEGNIMYLITPTGMYAIEIEP